MWKIAGLAAAIASGAVVWGAVVWGAAPAAAETPKQTFSITNDAHRVVECTFLVDGKTRNYLKVHMGKTFHDDFPPRTLLQLVCIRGAEGVFGPLKLGVDYRFVDRAGNHVAVVEGAQE